MAAVASPTNLAGKNHFNQDVYLKLMPNGTQAWAHVSKGQITNGGCNLIPLNFISNLKDPKRYRMVRVPSYTLCRLSNIDFEMIVNFRELVPAKELSRIDLSSIIGRARKYEEPRKEAAAGRPADVVEKIKGVGQELGIILNMFDRVEALFETEYFFYIKAPEGLFLSKNEIQMLKLELARGVFLYGKVPWISLSSNPDRSRAPIIHPVYQQTFVGHVISFLDYNMKYFFDGISYSHEFVCDWARNPIRDEEYLKSHCIDFKEYREISFRIIAKQNSIKRAENLYKIDGDFDIEYSIQPAPQIDEELNSYQIQDEACKRMSAQIRSLMPTLPLFKKYFQALSIINFLTYHYITLQKADKIPIIHDKPAHPGFFICPSSFPPIPISAVNLGIVTIFVTHLFETMTTRDRNTIFPAITDPAYPIIGESPAARCIANLLQSHSNTTLPIEPSFLISSAIYFLKVYRNMYEGFNKTMIHALVLGGYKKEDEQISPKTKSAFFEKNEHYLKITDEDIAKLEHSIQQKRRARQSIDVLLAELIEIQKFKEQTLLQIKMFKWWFESPVDCCGDGKYFLLNVLKNTSGFCNKKPDSESLLTGGCGIKRLDKNAEIDVSCTALLDEHFNSLKELPSEELLEIEGGALFKIALENLSLVDDKIKGPASSLFCYRSEKLFNPKHPDIFQAVMNSDKVLFNSLDFASFDIEDPQGVSIVHYASRKTNIFFLRSLIGKGATINVRDSEQFTPLHYAASVGNLSAVELLSNARPEMINAKGNNGQTALYFAAENGHLESVSYLLSHGADPSIQTNHGMNALLCSLYLRFEDVALKILESPLIDITTTLLKGTNALHLAVERNLEKACAELIRLGIDAKACQKWKYNPLHLAAQNGWLRGIQLLVKKCPYLNINSKTAFGMTPLQLAMKGDHKDVVRFLSEQGGEVFSEVASEKSPLPEIPSVPLKSLSSLHEICQIGDLNEAPLSSSRLEIAIRIGDLNAVSLFRNIEKSELPESAISSFAMRRRLY